MKGSLPRCFIEPSQWERIELIPAHDESRHIVRVLRCGAGDRLIIFDGRGREGEAEVSAIRHGVPILSKVWSRNAPSPGVRLVLVQAVIKAARMDYLVEKATELGVASIIPVMTERVVVRVAREDAVKRVERWRRICISAAAQCGTAWVPGVQNVTPYAGVFESLKGTPCLVGCLDEGTGTLRSAVASLRAGRPKQVALVIGPEGDLTPGEIELARSRGAVPVSFGGLVLRSETAAIFGLSALAYEFTG